MGLHPAVIALLLLAARLGAQQDSLAQVRAVLETEASRADVHWARLHVLLRSDSGTPRADASLEAWKKTYDTLVDSIGQRLQTPMVQVMIDPDGATAQGIRNRNGARSPFASADESASADSLRGVLERHGIHGEDGEGDMYYTASGTTLLREAGPFLTAPLRELVGLWALEDRAPSGGDATLLVSWEELVRRLEITDNLVTDHPSLAFGSDLRAHFMPYLNALLGGWDNSSGFSFGNPQVMLADARGRLERYAARHPNTRGGRIVKDYLAVLLANNWTRTRAVEDSQQQALRRAEAP